MKIYNPTYGALLEFDENHSADPKQIGRWILNYASPERGLTPSEISELKSKGKVGFYPDEFFLVGTDQWPLEKVLRHRQAVQAFERVNEKGPVFPHWDNVSRINERERIVLNFVPRPIADIILESSRDLAINHIYDIILAGVASKFRAQKTFKEKTLEHARNLVDAVREAAGLNALQEAGQQTVRGRILKLLANERNPLPPIEVARRTGLNRHSVRRELQKMLKQGLVIQQGHDYRLSQR